MYRRMAVRGAHETSLRLDRLESTRLSWAFAISVALHLFIWGGYSADKKFHLWDKIHLPEWVKAMTQSVAKVVKLEPPQPRIDREPPLMFVDVSSAQATPESPKNARYYSDKNSQAANPDADRDTGIPKITGTQTQVPKTEDVPRSKYDKLQPDFAQLAREREAAEQAKPAMTPGDLVMAKPDMNPRQDNGTATQSRPRTLKEAYARQQDNRAVGRKMKQDGGVSRRLDFASFDTKATTFGAYDAAFIDTVRQYWYDELDRRQYDGSAQGKVALRFHLNSDGTITELKVVDDTVGGIWMYLCQNAVLRPAPYEKWSREMRVEVGRNYREIQFTFYYN